MSRVAVGLGLIIAVAGATGGLHAQERDVASVRLGLTYEPGYVPQMVIMPAQVAPGLEDVAGVITRIVRTDLDYSDRFEILAPPDSLPSSDPPNYDLWNQLGIVWLVTMDVTGGSDAPLLRVGLHDVVYSRLDNVRAFSLPPLGATDFRMAVHRVSDEIVSWVTRGAQSGIAATRIALRRRNGDGTSSLILVDSDGEDIRQIRTDGQNVFSPVFSPDGSHIAFTEQTETGAFSLIEVNLITGRRRQVASGSLVLTPAYDPEGRLAYAAADRNFITNIVMEGGRSLTQSRAASLNPAFSPDGQSFAFESDPANEPQIYVQSLGGGTPRRISVYDRRERTNAVGPDWSPNGDRIAYAALNRRTWQVFTVNPDGTDRRMLTRRGENEDPSWAPDGRHLVFAQQDSRGSVIMILDVVTNRARILTSGRLDGLPDWSPRLPPGS